MHIWYLLIGTPKSLIPYCTNKVCYLLTSTSKSLPDIGRTVYRRTAKKEMNCNFIFECTKILERNTYHIVHYDVLLCEYRLGQCTLHVLSNQISHMCHTRPN